LHQIIKLLSGNWQEYLKNFLTILINLIILKLQIFDLNHLTCWIETMK